MDRTPLLPLYWLTPPHQTLQWVHPSGACGGLRLQRDGEWWTTGGGIVVDGVQYALLIPERLAQRILGRPAAEPAASTEQK